MLSTIFDGFLTTAFEVFIALVPIIAIMFLLHFVSLRLKKRELLTILRGFLMTYAGLVLFLQGVHIAFLPIGSHFGEALANFKYNGVLVPIGFVMGFVVAFAEPAVHVLNSQVEELTAGAIKKNVLLITLSLGVGTAVALSMVRALFSLSLWWFVLPGYIIIIAFSKYVDPTFVAIAFDSGGVATGPMCSTFLLSFNIGVSKITTGSADLASGLGMVALVAMAPILSIMLLSLIYKRKLPEE